MKFEIDFTYFFKKRVNLRSKTKCFSLVSRRERERKKKKHPISSKPIKERKKEQEPWRYLSLFVFS